MMQSSSQWSEELREATRAAVQNLTGVGSGEEICLKHTSGSFGLLESGPTGGELRVLDRHTNAVTAFRDADELIDAGWLLD